MVSLASTAGPLKWSCTLPDGTPFSTKLPEPLSVAVRSVPTTVTVTSPSPRASTGCAKVTASSAPSKASSTTDAGAADDATLPPRAVPLMVAPCARSDGAVGNGADHSPHPIVVSTSVNNTLTDLAIRMCRGLQ
jgi:hypothetical protein